MASNAKNRNLDEEDLFVTGNFGSKAAYNFGQMQEFFDEYGKKWPFDVWNSGMAGLPAGKNL